MTIPMLRAIFESLLQQAKDLPVDNAENDVASIHLLEAAKHIKAAIIELEDHETKSSFLRKDDN